MPYNAVIAAAQATLASTLAAIYNANNPVGSAQQTATAEATAAAIRVFTEMCLSNALVSTTVTTAVIGVGVCAVGGGPVTGSGNGNGTGSLS